MSNFRDYQFTESLISAIAVDENDGQFLWIAFKEVDGECLLKKVSAYDLTQVYFSIGVPVSAISDLKISGDYLFTAVTHATIAIYIFNVATPLSTQITLTKAEVGVEEAPIACAVGASNVYFLTPGVASGTNAQIINLSSNTAYIETMDLSESATIVTDAISFIVDASENIWTVTSDDPAKLYRSFYESGMWHIQQHELS